MAYFLGGLGAGILLMVGLYYWNIGRHRRKKELPSLTKYVVFSISATVIYSIAEFITSTVTGVSHDVLTERVYGFFAGEVIFCAILKIFKIKKQ